MESNENYSDELAEQSAFIFVAILDTPEQVSKNKKSYTGEFLKKIL